jgi:hypothetical protein
MINESERILIQTKWRRVAHFILRSRYLLDIHLSRFWSHSGYSGGGDKLTSGSGQLYSEVVPLESMSTQNAVGIPNRYFHCNSQARPDQMAMTTEEPKVTEQSATMTGNITDSEDEDDSVESGEDEPEDPDSEFTKFKRPIWNHFFRSPWNNDSLRRQCLTFCLDHCSTRDQVKITSTACQFDSIYLIPSTIWSIFFYVIV